MDFLPDNDNSDFGDLPYVPFVGTDMGGTVHNWEFVFPNVTGKSAYSAYSDLTISTSPTISAPIGVQFDLPESNTTEYVSYFKQASSEVYVDDSLTVVNSSASFVYDYTGTNQKFPASLGMDLYCVMADFSWLPVAGASWYTLRYEKDGGSEVEFVTMTYLIYRRPFLALSLGRRMRSSSTVTLISRPPFYQLPVSLPR